MKICNMSARSITIKPKSELCQIQEVKVVDSLPSDLYEPEGESSVKETSPPEELGVQLDTDNLSSEEVT